jgi:hypothetical protein
MLIKLDGALNLKEPISGPVRLGPSRRPVPRWHRPPEPGLNVWGPSTSPGQFLIRDWPERMGPCIVHCKVLHSKRMCILPLV